MSHSTSMNHSKVVFSQIIFFKRSKISNLGFQATVRVMTWWIFMHPSRNCSNWPLAKQWKCNEPWMSWSAIPLDERIWVDPMMLGIGRCCKTRIVGESFDWRLLCSSVNQAPGPKFPDTKSRNHKRRRKGRCTSFHTKSEPAIHTVAVIQKVILMPLQPFYTNRTLSTVHTSPKSAFAASTCRVFRKSEILPVSFRGSPGRKFQGEKNDKPKKEFVYRMCAGRPTSAMPKPSFLAGCVSVVCRGWCGNVLSRGWLRGEMKKCGGLWGDVRWGNVVSCETSCHVAWCNVMWCHVHVMSFDVMWFFVFCHVIWCHVMLLCDVMSSGVK